MLFKFRCFYSQLFFAEIMIVSIPLFMYLAFYLFIFNSDPVVRDDMNNYISQYYSEASSGK